MENINVLIVEENKSVAEDVERRLKVLEYTVCAIVPTGAEAVEKAAEMQPDVVLINIELEGEIDGIETAKRIRDSLDIPTIYLADYSNDAFVEKKDLFKRAEITNPFDYLPLPHGKRRLYLTIEGTVYQHKMERETKIKEQQLSTILNSISDAVIATDNKELITFMNPAAERLTGWQLEHAASVNIKQIFQIDTEGDCPITTVLRNMLDTDTAVSPESPTDAEVKDSTVFTSKSGRKTHIDYSIAPSINQKGRVIGTVITFRDITDYKALEEELNQTINQLQDQTLLMETIFDSMSDGVMAVDTEGQYLMVNTRAQEMVGPFSEDILIADRPERYGLFHPDGKTLFSGGELPITRALRGETTDNIEMLVSNDTQAEEIFINISGRPLLDRQGNLKGGVIVFRNMTELKAAQTKLEQTFNELRDKTQLMETVFDSMSDGIAVIDVTGRIVFVNPSIKQMLGTRPLDTSASNWSETYGVFYPDKERHIPIDQILSTHIFRGEAIRDREIFVRNEEQKDGINVMVSGLPLFDENRDVIGCVAILRDITESKVAEAQLEKTMQELQNQVQLTDTVFNSISDGVVVTDEAGNFLLVNPSAERIVGMGATDTPPDQWSDTYGTFYPDKVTPFPNEKLPLIQAMQGRVTDEVDLFICNPENPEGCFINVTGRPLQDERNSVRGGVIVFRDVTKTKSTEAKLEQTVSELEDKTQLMDTVFNSMNDGVLVLDTMGQVLFTNSSVELACIDSPRDVDSSEWTETYGIFYVDKETPVLTDQMPVMRALRGEQIEDEEFFIRNIHNNARNNLLTDGLFIATSASPLLDKDQQIIGSVGIIRDITEQKAATMQLEQTMQELQDQTQLMDIIFNNMSDGVVVADDKGQYIMANPAAEQMVGQGFEGLDLPRASEQYGVFHPTTESLFPPDQLPLARAIKGESTNNVEMRIDNEKLPQEVYVSVNGRPLLDEKSVSRGGVVVVRDITELKQTQIQLENQTQLLETVFNNMSDGVLVAAENGEYIMANPAAEQMIGGQQFDALDLPQSSEQYGLFDPTTGSLFTPDQLPLTRAVKGESTDNIEMHIRNPQLSQEVYVSVNGRPLLDEKGVSRGGWLLPTISRSSNRHRSSWSKQSLSWKIRANSWKSFLII